MCIGGYAISISKYTNNNTSVNINILFNVYHNVFYCISDEYQLI